MSIYFPESEEIYFKKTREYFKEVVFLSNCSLRLKYIFYGFLDGLKGENGSFEKLHSEK